MRYHTLHQFSSTLTRMNNSAFVYSSSVPFHAFRYCNVRIGLIVTLKHPKKERVGGKKNKNGKEERTNGRKKGTRRQQQQQKLEREKKMLCYTVYVNALEFVTYKNIIKTDREKEGGQREGDDRDRR